MSPQKKKTARGANGDEAPPSGADPLTDVVSGIGAKVRLMRTRKGYSLQQLANRASLSAAAIHKIEHNGMVPTITTLLKIASALNRPVAYFISEEAETDKPMIHTTPETRRPVFTSINGLDLRNVAGPYGRFFIAGAYAVADSGAESGTETTTHPGEELVYLLEGKLVFEFDEEKVELRPGDSIHFRGDHSHRWHNPTSKPAKAVWLALRPM